MLQAEQVLHERYQLKELLGNHAGRQTWLAEDLAVETRQLAIVKLLPFSPQTQWDDLKLFEREALVLKHLNHPQIPKYRDSFSVSKEAGSGLPWFALVQDYIPGSSLQQLLKSGRRFTEVEVQDIATQLLNILIYLHELSPPVLHRDVKPSNIICDSQGQIYLVDFGAVQDKAKAEGVTFTVVGTGGYAPPEQLWGRAVPASDLYALGATLIHLLTGTSPAELPQRRMRLQFRDKVTLTPKFAHWLDKLTDPAPERRFSQARQALLALQSDSDSSSFASSDGYETNQKARYGRLGRLAVLQYAVVFLFAIAVPSFVVYRKHGHSEAKHTIGSMNRAQQAYHLEYGEFTTSMPALGIGIKNLTENYEYSVRTTPLVAFNYATPRKDTLKGFVGGTFLISADDGTDEILTVAIACEANSPGLSLPAEPIVRGNVIECSSNTTSLSGTADNDTGRIVLGRDLALAYNSLNYAMAGEYDQSLLVAETIESGKLKDRVFKAIANQVTAANRRLQAPENLFQAVEVAATIQDTQIKAWVLADLARKLATADQQSLATRILSLALDLAEPMEDAYTKALVLADIARGLAAVGQPLQAEKIFAQALQNAQSTEDANALTYIVGKYAATGQYDRAIEVAKTFKSYYGKDTAFEAIARELTAMGHYDRALEVIQTIRDPNIQARALTDITRKQVEAGIAEPTERIFAQVLKLTETIPSSVDRGTTLEAIARELVTAGRYNQALKVVETIKDEHTRERVLESLVRHLAAVGRYNQAVNLAKTIKDDSTREKVLEAIAGD